MVFLSRDNHTGDPPDRTPLPYTPPMWVRLDWVFPHPTDAPQTSVPDGLDLVGNARASMSSGAWVRSSRGMWLTTCSIEIPYADGRRTFKVDHQLVPGYALQRRPPGDDDKIRNRFEL
jgi:hypothetical protein